MPILIGLAIHTIFQSQISNFKQQIQIKGTSLEYLFYELLQTKKRACIVETQYIYIYIYIYMWVIAPERS